MTDSNIYEKFSNRLTNLREKKTLTQLQLAEKTGFEQAYISLLENGKRNPTLETLNILSIALGCKISDLVD